MRRLALAAGAWMTCGALASCTLELAPSIPATTSGGTRVVPELLDGTRDCDERCPRRDGLRVDDCHPTRLAPTLARHRSNLGEPDEAWLLCYYERE